MTRQQDRNRPHRRLIDPNGPAPMLIGGAVAAGIVLAAVVYNFNRQSVASHAAPSVTTGAPAQTTGSGATRR